MDQLERIEQKLDRIIRFFNIEQEPRRSRAELRNLAKEMLRKKSVAHKKRT